jgi:hypothetical protein
VTPVVPIAPEAHANGVGPPILAFEATKGGERVMLLEAFAEPDGHVTVDAEVWSMKGERRHEPVRTSYRFGNVGIATKFVDEAMITLEYLNCDVAKLHGGARD